MKHALRLLLVTLPALAFADDAHTVVQMGRAFHPGEVTIGTGENLTFKNNDIYIHQIYAKGLFDTDEKAPGETLVETFPRPGTFEVRCHIHPKMRLMVYVR